MNTDANITINLKGRLSYSTTKWILDEDSPVSLEVKATLMRDMLVSGDNRKDVYSEFVTTPILIQVLTQHNDAILASALLEKRLVQSIFDGLKSQAAKDTKVADVLILLAKHCLDVSMNDQISLGQLRSEILRIDAQIVDNADSSLAALLAHGLFETEPKILGEAIWGRRKAYMLGKASAKQTSAKPTPTASAQALIDCPDIITQAINAITEGVAEEERTYV